MTMSIFAVSVKRGEQLVGHEGLPQSCWHSLRHGGKQRARSLEEECEGKDWK